jgi:thioredoxin reductase (NADPH)
MQGFSMVTIHNIRLLLLCISIGVYNSAVCFEEMVSKPIEKAFDKDNVIPVAVLGSGPAGLTAALYTTRAKIHTVVFTGAMPGGQLTNTTFVENWPGIKKKYGYEIMQTLREQVEEYEAVIVEDSIIDVDFHQWPFKLFTESGSSLNALSVVIAMGSAPRRLSVPGELEYWGKGVTPCAVCDCAFFKNKDVVVIGGGDAAVEEALQLASYAKTVTLLVRNNRMRAARRMQAKLDDYSNVTIVYNKQVLEILGDGSTVTGIKLQDIESQETNVVSAQGVFLAIGHNPNTDLFKPYIQITKSGYIELKSCSQGTSITGVFAAGDVEDAKFRQAVVASASGCKAGLEAVEWLRDIGLTDLVARKLKLFLESDVK